MRISDWSSDVCSTDLSVEQALGPGLLQLVDAADGFADGGMGRDAGMEQLIQTDQQKGFDIAIGSLEWLLQQLVGQTCQARMPARGAEGQVLGQAAVARVHLDRKSTRLTPVTNAHLVCRLLLEKKKDSNN